MVPSGIHNHIGSVMQNGNTAALTVSELTFNDGSTVCLQEGEIVVVVGANNSGKSSALREAYQLIGHHLSTIVIKDVKLKRPNDAEQLWALVQRVGTPHEGQPDVYNIGHTAFSRPALTRIFMGEEKLEQNANMFVVYIGAEARLSLAHGVTTIDFGRQARTHPLHMIFDDPSLEEKLQSAFRLAFGTGIAVDRMAGSVIPLHIGEDVERAHGEDLLSPTYRSRLRAAPRLDTQGDGMKGFVGILLHVMLGHHSVALVDEPEAFLHPPQAKLLGRLIAENKNPPKQLFIATHSADILRGVLEAKNASVRVLRLQRSGNTNHVFELSPEGVRQVWADPALRFSDILSGLFHEKVVLCEAEGDCRFYAAIADALRVSPGHTSARDVMFTQSGGKGGMPKLIRALQRLRVPICAVVDFDALTSHGQLRAIVEALGGSWSDFEADFTVIKRSIDGLGKVRSTDFKRALLDVVSNIAESDEEISRKVVTAVRQIIKTSIGAERVKQSGEGALTREARQAAARLFTAFEKLGLFVVRGGELESFVIAETSDKNAWVAAVLEKYADALGTASELEDARKFVERLIAKPANPSGQLASLGPGACTA